MAAPYARRFHAANERIERRLRALDLVSTLPATFTVIEVPKFYPWPTTKEIGISSVITRAVEVGAARVVIERDDSNLACDRRVASAVTRKLAPARRPEYVHLRAFEEPLLWVPDLVAWCWSKDARWRGELSRRGVVVGECPVA